MKEKIAIVGLGCLFPDAFDIQQFWQNILNKKVSIKELPDDILNREVYYRPELFQSFDKKEKTYTNMAGWIPHLKFDTFRKYKIPPAIADRMDDNQHASLYTSNQALQSCKMGAISKDKVGVIFGNGMVGAHHTYSEYRIVFQHIAYTIQNILKENLTNTEIEKLIQDIQNTILGKSFSITEDSAPGILPNIVAARVANVFDFHGPSYTIDSACASALTSIINGVLQLQNHAYDAMVCGASDMAMLPLGMIYFSAIGALSPDGSFPFDKRANGFIMGQGAGAVVLKRLEDAIRDQDTIYAVITGYGQGSDGKGKYIAAPNELWQAKTVEQAYRMAGYSIDTVEMIEAHGTATTVGDVAEVAALKRSFALLESKRKNFCGLGSVKSNIGHLKSAAGIAGLLKAVLALHHKFLPPTAGFEEINPKLKIEDSPFYILKDGKAWEAKKEHPRRVGVSAFGFGGADYHIALEEYRPEDYKDKKSVTVALSETIKQESVTQKEGTTEVFFFSGDSFQNILEQWKNLINFLTDNFAETAFIHNYEANASAPCRLAVVAQSKEELAEKSEIFFKYSTSPDAKELRSLETKGIFYREGKGITQEQTALLFSGQASQYPNMFLGLYNRYPLFQQLYQDADTFWQKKYGHTISSLIFSEKEEAQAVEILRSTQNTHPAIFISNFAMFQLLKQMGVRSSYLIGHSLGEICALAAAEVLSFRESLALLGARGYAFLEAKLDDFGKMASVNASAAQVQQWINDNKKDIQIANINSPRQTIISGRSSEIEEAVKLLSQNKMRTTLLNVSHAFHSPVVKRVAELFYQKIQKMQFQPFQTKVMANHLTDFYPQNSPEKMPELLQEQISRSVDFVSSIQKLYDMGVRLFLEIGPGSVLGSLTKDILSDKDVTVLNVNYRNKDDIDSFQRFLGSLFVQGVGLQLIAHHSTKPSVARIEILEKKEIPSPSQVEKIQDIPAKAPETRIAEVTKPVVFRQEFPDIVFSGVSVGLPGSYKKSFRDDNFEQLFAGHNFIERLSDVEKQKMVDLQITKLIKSEKGAAFQVLASLDEVIQLAGKIGKIDMIQDYHIEEEHAQNMSDCIAHGVAAGYEALRDAHIPLVYEYEGASPQAKFKLAKKLALPKEMQEETGIIFANGFPMIDPFIREVSSFVANQYQNKLRKALQRFYETIIEKVSDLKIQKILIDWYSLNYGNLSNIPGKEEVYHFNYHFMDQISSQANNRLAFLINAKGPNFQLNAACSSCCCAISIAEDFIRTGRVKRMILIGADTPVNETNLPWLGAGFAATGAATVEGNLYEAAIPFDKRRNGMIIGSGAVGIVVETASEVEKRGIIPVCRLLGSHSFNSGFHPSRLDIRHSSHQMDKFISEMEKRHNLRRSEMAGQMIYMSHETYTPPKGGCSQCEADALKHTFAEKFTEIIVSNTKGMTGHPMGASIETVTAAKALQYQKVPPVVNYKVPDPNLSGLNLSKGGEYKFRYALQMAAGFGSQGNYVLLERKAQGDTRIESQDKYKKWLQQVSSNPNPQIENIGRILAIQDSGKTQSEPILQKTSSEKKQEPDTLVTPPTMPQKKVSMPAASTELPSKATITKSILEIFSQVTKYPEEMLEMDMEMEADLGIDTVKQATILSIIGEKYGMKRDENIRLSDYPTIGRLVDLVFRLQGNSLPESSTSKVGEKQQEIEAVPSSQEGKVDKKQLLAEILKIFSQVTKYPEEMLEMDMEMEADLGIDTVKQATILSMIGEKYGMKRDESIRLSDYPTIGSLVDLIYRLQGGVNQVETDIKAEQSKIGKKIEQPVEKSKKNEIFEKETPSSSIPSTASQEKRGDKIQLLGEILKIFSQVTKYPEEMLEMDMEMEADLGIDTVKQATILSMIGEKYGMSRDENIRLSDYPTIGSLVDLIYQKSQPQKNQEVVPGVVQKKTPAIAEDDFFVESLTRHVPVLCEKKLPEKNYSVQDKTLWLLAEKDCESLVEKMQKFFHQKNLHTSVFYFIRGNSPEKILESFQEFIAKNKEAEMIIDCTHAGFPVAFQNLSLQDAEEYLALNSEFRFLLYQYLAKESKKRPDRLLCLTSMDGYLGYSASNSIEDPLYGALAGFYKGLRKEWKECIIKIVDVHPVLFQKQLEGYLASILQEIEYSDRTMEIVYPEPGKRLIVKLDEKELHKESPVTFDEKTTFLVTGGALGITGKVVTHIAQQYKSQFILVGRTALPENIQSLIHFQEEDWKKVKENIMQDLKKQHERVTPSMVNQEYEKLTRAVDVYRQLEEIQKPGSKVEYIACDIRNYAEFQEKLAQARKKLGPVHAIIHGSGVEKSHLIEQKTLSEFRDVFYTKALGAFNLMSLCSTEPVKMIMAFSSISGRFGNEAQLDYCAANSFLNYWIKSLRTFYPETHSISLDWSGWKEIGIAWRNEFVREYAQEQGLNLISPDSGAKAALEEASWMTKDSEVVLSKGLRTFAEPDLFVTDLSRTPFIDRVEKKEGKIVRAYRVLSSKRDAILDQHRLGSDPILPAVGSIEMFIEFYSLLEGNQNRYFLKDLKFLNPVKLHHDTPHEFYLEGNKNDQGEWSLSINSIFQPKKLKQIQKIIHNTGIVSPLEENFLDIHPKNWSYDRQKMKRMRIEECNILYKKHHEAYRTIHFGQLFDEMFSNIGAYRDDDIFYDDIYMIKPHISVTTEQLTNKNYPLLETQINPCWLDSMYSVLGIECLIHTGRTHLPWTADVIGIVKVPRTPQMFYSYTHLLKTDGVERIYDVVIMDSKENILCYARSASMKLITL